MNKYLCTRWAFELSNWTPTLPQLAQAITAIQPEERTRLMKFVFIDDFLSSLVGRLLMRKYVSTQSGLDYHSVKFARDVRGKPYWVGGGEDAGVLLLHPSQLSFNVSHQNNFVLLAGVVAQVDEAASVDFGVGVDVMKIEYSGGKPLAEFFRLMHNKFSAEEWSYITRSRHRSDAQRVKAFMRHWCLKEAYVKEIGVGITIDLQKISFTVNAGVEPELNSLPLNSTTLRCNDVAMHNWYFEEHLLSPDYCAAIAFRNCQPAKDKFQFLEIDDILVNSGKAVDAVIMEYCKEALQKQRKK